jgi:hypothetical protein
MLANTDAQSYIEITWPNKEAKEEKDYNFRGLIYAKLSNYQVQFIHSKYHSCINNNITGA